MFALFQRGQIAEGFARPVVQFPLNLLNHLIRQFAEIRTLRDVLANQTVCIFVCAPLPGVVRTCEIELGIESLRNLLMAGEFLPVVSRYRMYLFDSRCRMLNSLIIN